MEPHHVKVGDSSDHSRRVRVVHISDTHRRHAEFAKAIPDGDILVHSGDFDSFSLAKLPLLRLLEEREIGKVAAFFDSQSHQHKVFVPGNHDMRLASYHLAGGRGRGSLASRLASSCHVLIDSEVTLCGLKFYGIPWCPLRDASYARAFSEPWESLLPRWQAAPADTDVLVTHIPPWEELGREVRERIRPLALLHGHIHRGNGVKYWEKGGSDSSVLVSNAAMDEIPKPVVIDFYHES
ncbi:hypothetical protein BOX15_Mlig006851g1 [Macrostomum lignano]|uniref:Metallophos domain-containing protein n=2 Tax=Macrostomum lignano TaxID=282301 RepID=A0A1I8JAC3_9PLAT|nr:hypothetical protein BOX15_Mlig006851g1 [Macrostomum lignano]